MPPQPDPQPTFMERYRFVQWLMQFPALTLMVFLRRDLGYRIVNPLALIAVTGVLFVGCVLAQPNNAEARPIDLLIFALGAFALGMAQRIRRWWQLNNQARQHSYYIGSSPFDFRWLPNFVRRNRRVARFVDPIFCALIGAALFPYSRALAVWLVFSGLCLRAYEYNVHQHERNRQLDLMDGLMNSEQQASIVEQYEQGPWAQPRTEPGVPTGLGNDVRENIKRRKVDQTRPQP